jgi:hypothetical protein
MFRVAFACLAACLLAAPAAPAAAGSRQALETLSGTYASAAPEPWGPGAWGTRSFAFEGGRWSLTFTLALDPRMEAKVFSFRTFGPYRVLAPVAGATHAADFGEERKFVTLHAADPALVAAFGLGGCGLVPGVEKDISEAGCARWKPVATCGTDHDLLAMDGQGRLFFGERPRDNDMCTPDRRPAALFPHPLLRATAQ